MIKLWKVQDKILKASKALTTDELKKVLAESRVELRKAQNKM